MFFAIHCLDLPDAAERRAAARPAHSDRLRTGEGRAVLYGALLDPDDGVPVGSLLLVEAASRQEVDLFLAGDPFTTGRVWGEVRVHALSPSRHSTVSLPEGAPARQEN
jgi:uncharacterized protein